MREQVKSLTQSRFEPSKPSADSEAALERLPTIQGLENFGASSPRFSSISPLAPSPGFCPRTGFVAPQPPGCRRGRGPRAIYARDVRSLQAWTPGPARYSPSFRSGAGPGGALRGSASVLETALRRYIAPAARSAADSAARSRCEARGAGASSARGRSADPCPAPPVCPREVGTGCSPASSSRNLVSRLCCSLPGPRNELYAPSQKRDRKPRSHHHLPNSGGQAGDGLGTCNVNKIDMVYHVGCSPNPF